MSEQYIVSARKYRPDTFASIVGQGAMSSTLRAAVLNERMAHAYLFCGPRGVGKTTAARVLAKTINCLNPSQDGEACNVCESCQAFNEGRSFNIFELDAASNNSVEDIRSLTDQVLIAPVLGRYKVYIIDEVHMLSQAAFNAFLKTLEEPPSYAIFILATTEKHKILPTILSRCQVYDFKRITVGDITRHLQYVAQSEGIQAEEEALGLIAEKADGGMRDALSMFDRVASYGQGTISYQTALDCLNILDYNYYIRFIQGFVSGDYRGLLMTLDEVLARGFDGQLVMSGLASFARDLLVVQHEETIKLLEKPQPVQQLYAETARLVAPSALHQIIRMLVGADNQYKAASNKRLLIELTFLNILSAFQPNALEKAAIQPTAELPARSVAVTPPQTNTATPSVSTATQVEVAKPASKPEEPIPADSQQPIQEQEKTTHKGGEQTPPVTPSIPANRIDGLQTRQRFRNRKAKTETAEEHTKLSEEWDNSYTESDVQQAWLRYVEQELGEDQIFLKNILGNILPKLQEGNKVILPLVDTASIIEPVQNSLIKIQNYIQRSVHNTQLEIHIDAVAPELNYQPTTNKEKYEALEQEYPLLKEFREQLDLRVL